MNEVDGDDGTHEVVYLTVVVEEIVTVVFPELFDSSRFGIFELVDNKYKNFVKIFHCF